MRPGFRTRKKSGFILVTVLFISTLLLSAAATFAWFARQEMRRTSYEEFALVSRSLASVACQVIGGWIGSDSNGYDSELELLYMPNYPLLLFFGDWEVTAKITPQNRLFPINGLFLPDGVTMRTEFEYAWQEFWRLMGNDRMSLILLDFLDSDTEARPGSLEEEYYVNRKISHLSELLRVERMEGDMIYTRGGGTEAVTIDRFFTVYGEGPININVAPKEILAALDPEIGPDIADAILIYRSENKIESERDLVKIPGFPMAAHTRLANVLTYRSDYFLLDMKVARGSRERNFSVMLRRSGPICQILSWGE
jgi:type II secretory pathway component PulK